LLKIEGLSIFHDDLKIGFQYPCHIIKSRKKFKGEVQMYNWSKDIVAIGNKTILKNNDEPKERCLEKIKNLIDKTNIHPPNHRSNHETRVELYT